MTWDSAQQFCSTRGGALASANNGDEFLAMRALAQESDDSQIWIAGTDREEEGTWRCKQQSTQLGSACTVMPWALNEPNNAGSGEDCAAMDRNREYLLNDAPCKMKYSVLCKFTDNVE